MKSSLFTAPPDWQWLIILYFFIGGLAGGSYFIAALLDLFGRTTDRPLARLGYLVAFPATVVSGVLLILDLQRPLRFWHMLLQSDTGRPMFKPWSPMSVGSWALLIFGAFTFISFLAAVVETREVLWRWVHTLRPPGTVGTVFAVLGGMAGFFIAGYTGVLLAVTNRPIWSDTSLIGLTFVVSAASTSAALLVLLAYRRAGQVPALHELERFDAWVLVLELLALIALVASLGSVARLWLNAWGVLLVVGVVVVGILIPLVLHWRPRAVGGLTTPAAAILVLVGGFLLRVVIVLSSERM
jgi:formate-dependent nitrite reductase membrane component NrfD